MCNGYPNNTCHDAAAGLQTAMQPPYYNYSTQKSLLIDSILSGSEAAEGMWFA